VAARLNAGEIRWQLHFEAECDSTQDLARLAAMQGAGEGWTLATDLQRRGRGRSGRAWVAPAGRALTFSLVLQPPVDVLPLLPLLAAITVAGGIEAATRAIADLKWPNDILLDGKKLAGVLLEHPPGPLVIVGIGVNVNQTADELPPNATSLAMALGHPVEREELLAAILNDLANGYERADREGVQWILPGWRSRSSMLGKPVSFQRDGARLHGIAEDIGLDGALLVRTADGTRISVVAGEVELVRVD
jgi:BirA family biotin operon repressor/biotin-[acetyl-CoA-carboxylase] ligase